MEKRKLSFGIDLGTTNSAISTVISGSTPTILPIGRGGAHIMPSCVMWLGGDEFEVGEYAYEHFEQENVAYSFKRIIGSNQKVTLTHNGESREFTPIELSAQVLKELCKRVEPTYGKVEDVVITVPAYFTDDQVAATRKAGEMIGLNVMSTFREPVASALVYAVHNLQALENDLERFMVYDLGGGTFDVSIVEVHKDMDYSEIDEFYGFTSLDNSDNSSAGITLNVKGKYGDMMLGGDDIDELMLQTTLNQIERQGHSISGLSAKTRRELKHFCEKFKKEGAYAMDRTLDLNYSDGTVIEDVKVKISSNDLRVATSEIYKRTQSAEAKQTVRKALGTNKLDGILLIGGSTKNPYIVEMLEKSYPGVPLNRRLNPDEAVCLGAGLQAHRLVCGDTAIKVNDVLPLPIGILADGRISRILKKNTHVPALERLVVHTQEDGQEQVRIKVYQGNSSFPEDSHFIGELLVDNIPDAPAGSFPIIVTLTVNLDGVLNCKVDIEGEVRSLVLTNIFKGGSSKADPKPHKAEALLERWRELATKQSRGKEMLQAIEEFEKGDMSIEDLLKRLVSLKDNVGDALSKMQVRGRC